MTEKQARRLFDAFKDEGFRGGFDLSMSCVDGYFSRGKHAGRPRSNIYRVSVTVFPDKLENFQCVTRELRACSYTMDHSDEIVTYYFDMATFKGG